MSKGLGTMQRAILEALVASKRLHARDVLGYRGGSWLKWPPISIYHGRDIRLPDETFDVRAVKVLLTRAFGKASRVYANSYEATHSIDAAFSRALRSLIRRGVLQHWSDDPHCANVYSAYPIELPEVRFVTCPGGAPTEVTIIELQRAIQLLEDKHAHSNAQLKAFTTAPSAGSRGS